jgi:hypothetical protein
MLFQKIGHGVSKLFTKQGTRNLFNKVSEVARKADNSVAKVGAFLVPTARHFGLGTVANGISGVVNSSNAVRNNLEKAIKDPMSKIREQFR